MKKNFSLLFTIIFFIVSSSKSQSPLPIFKNGGPSLNTYLYKYIETNYQLKNYDTLCLSSCSFIKFKISDDGNVTDLHFTYHTPTIIKEIFSKALFSTNGFWSYGVNKRTAKEHSSFVLPVVFIFESNCKPVERSSNSVLDILIDDDNPKAAQPVLPGTSDNAVLNYNILNPIFIKSGYE